MTNIEDEISQLSSKLFKLLDNPRELIGLEFQFCSECHKFEMPGNSPNESHRWHRQEYEYIGYGLPKFREDFYKSVNDLQSSPAELLEYLQVCQVEWALVPPFFQEIKEYEKNCV